MVIASDWDLESELEYENRCIPCEARKQFLKDHRVPLVGLAFILGFVTYKIVTGR